jgi:hypothetical protein
VDGGAEPNGANTGQRFPHGLVTLVFVLVKLYRFARTTVDQASRQLEPHSRPARFSEHSCGDRLATMPDLSPVVDEFLHPDPRYSVHPGNFTLAPPPRS